jgi:hypothetical protein
MGESDYAKARTRGKLHRFIGGMLRRCNSLTLLVEVNNGRVFATHQHIGVEQIRLACIVGSINRARDFDRNFNPVSNATYERWERINKAFLDDVVLPPVELQKVGDTYFVRDGHHRISVARFHGAEYIDAEVIDSICPIEAAA